MISYYHMVGLSQRRKVNAVTGCKGGKGCFETKIS